MKYNVWKYPASLFLFLFCVSAFSAPLFSWKTEQKSGKTVVTAEMVEDAYLYRDKTNVEAFDKNGRQLQAISTPQDIAHRDEFFGESHVYPAPRAVWVFPGTGIARIEAQYRGCGKNLCTLPLFYNWPEESGNSVSVELSGKAHYRVLSGMFSPEELLEFIDKKDVSPSSVSATAPETTHWWYLFLVILGGLGLNLTPCILPMMPVNLAILGAGEERKSALQGFWRGFAYAAGIVIAYGTLGLLAVTAGVKFGSLNSSAAFNWAIAAVFLALGLPMLRGSGLDLTRFAGRIHWIKFRSGKLLLAFFMGMAAALLAGACVAPVVIGVLLLAANSYAGGNVFAVLWPFLLGVGMALPWPLAGAGLAVLPRPGHFMVYIKNFFAALIVLAGIYYGYTAYTLSFDHYDPDFQLAKLEDARKQAKSENKKLLIDFWASWCKNCKALENSTMRDERVKKALEKLVFVKFQAEELNDPSVKKILDEYGLRGLPSMVLVDYSGGTDE